MYDVAVIGAGPSGSMSAKLVAEAGYKVALIDKEEIPRYKPCGGAIELTLVPKYKIPNEVLEREVETIALYHTSGKVYSRIGPGAVVWRLKFDAYFQNLAAAAGAKLMDSRILKKVGWRNDYYQLELGKEKIKAKIVVAADGANSHTLKSIGWDPFKPSEVYLTVQKEILSSERKIAEIIGERTINFYFGKDISKFGYGWAFPKKNVISLGWGCRLSEIDNTVKSFQKFLNYGPVKKVLSSGDTIRTAAHLVPLKTREVFHERGVLAVGDAAGLVDPISGKGIPYALESGELAAKTIIRALSEENMEKLAGYDEALQKSFLPVLKAKYDIVFDVYKNDENITRYLEMWQKYRASEIALNLWRRGQES
ncbi:MAG: NAD(P)/FAD-dependent oxidoreductase [Candidatus Jordarchaeaceae archaeon]